MKTSVRNGFDMMKICTRNHSDIHNKDKKGILFESNSAMLWKSAISALLCILILAGCGQKASVAKPDLSSLGAIGSVAREDGSGTRTQFETLINTTEPGAAVTADSTEKVIEYVEQNPGAIGYAALSALTGQENSADSAERNDSSGSSAGITSNASDPSAQSLSISLKVLSVDGIQPSLQNIRNQKYPLSRHYYLAWYGDLSDLGQEFLTYARSAGQAVVAEDAVPVAKESSFLSLKPSGTLKITGSTSMATMVRKLAEGYEAINPNATVEVTESDSSQGLLDVVQSKADLAMSSRDLKDYEQQLLSFRPIAADGIAIVVNSENTLTDISIDELKEIYDGTVTEWSDF